MVKAISLSASQGVLRADGPAATVAATRRIRAILTALRCSVRQAFGHLADPPRYPADTTGGDILATVSRRAPVRDQARVWTGRNRVFGCRAPALPACGLNDATAAGLQALRRADVYDLPGGGERCG